MRGPGQVLKVARSVLAATCFVGVAATAVGQGRVRIDDRSVTVTRGSGRQVVVSTLAGVGAVIADDAKVRAEDLEVVFDAGKKTYHVRNRGGSKEVYAEMDASGGYTVHVKKGRRSAVIESGLSGAGAVLRAESGGRAVELTSNQLDAMAESWRVNGLNEGEMEANLRSLQTLGVELDELGYALDDLGRSLDEMGRRLEGTLGTGGTVRAEGSPPPRASQGSAPVVGKPIRCDGAEVIRIEGETIEAEGVIVDARGRCEVWIENSHIKSRADFAILASNRAGVHISGSRIEGRRGAVDVSGRAEVEANDTEFKGAVNASADAAFHDNGGNKFNR